MVTIDADGNLTSEMTTTRWRSTLDFNPYAMVEAETFCLVS